MFYSFLYIGLVSLGRFIPKYFILFIAIVNEIVFLISLSVFSLLGMQKIGMQGILV